MAEPILDVERLYEEHGRCIHTLAARLLGPDVDPLPLVVDVLDAACRWPRPPGGEKIRVWLATLTVEHLKFYRGVTWQRGTGRTGDRQPARLEPPPDQQALIPREREMLFELYRRLDILAEKKRTAFVLYEIEGYSCVEISRMLGVPVPTIYGRLRAARDELELIGKKAGARAE